MDISNLDYKKLDGKRNLEDAHPKEISTSNVGEPTVYAIADSGYAKGQPTIDTNILFIVSGGSEREKDYFHPINKCSRRVKIAFVSKRNQGLNPEQLVDKANEFIRLKLFTTERDERYHIEDADIIFLLQDIDEYYEDLQCIIPKTKDCQQLKWIISNPSFEVWLYYHYFDNPEHLAFGLSLDVSKRSQWLKRYLHEIIKGGVQTTKAIYDIPTAIANSLKNYQEDNNELPMVYSTQMHILATDILSAMGDEFDEMINQRAKEVEHFRRSLSQTT